MIAGTLNESHQFRGWNSCRHSDHDLHL